MSNQKNSNLGDEIKDIVQNALNNKDFNKLNQNIQNVVKSALDEANRSIHQKNWNRNNKNTRNTRKNYSQVHRREGGKIKPSVNQSKLAIPVGRVSGNLLTILGIIGTTIFGIGISVMLLLGLFILGKSLFFTIAAILSPFLILSIILLINGNITRKRLKRFQKYMLQIKGRNYCLIKDLSAATGLSNKFIEKDLKKMIDIGMFPQGHMDDEKTYFMLSNEIYEQYLELKRSVAMKNLDKIKNEKYEEEIRKSKEEKSSRKGRLDPEVRKSIEEGREFISQIKEANLAIPGEVISLKLDRLEEVTGKIFDYVEIHPEKADEIKKFTEYFLPTTLKLVHAYRKLENQAIQGENISSTKKEIEKTMDTINLAFENLLDDLFEDLAMDISTDISVLEIMFAQEGLTKDNIRARNKEEKDE